MPNPASPSNAMVGSLSNFVVRGSVLRKIRGERERVKCPEGPVAVFFGYIESCKRKWKLLLQWRIKWKRKWKMKWKLGNI